MWKAECGITHRGELRANLGSPVQGEPARLLAFNGATEGLYRRPVTAFTLIFSVILHKIPAPFLCNPPNFQKGCYIFAIFASIYMKAFFEIEI